MTKELNKKQTLGRFDIVGEITVDSKAFTLESKSKNNPNWTCNIFNPKINGENGLSMFIRIQDGFDIVNGKTIYLKTINDEQMELSFLDRFNKALVERVNDKSFIKVFTKRIESVNEENGIKFMTWEEPKKFLTMFDTISYLKSIMPMASTNKVRMTGEVKYSVYNGKLQRNFELKTFYILTNNEEVGKEKPLGFNFTQNIIVTKDSVDMDKFETDNMATINAKLYVRKAKEKYELLNLPLIVRTNEENKDKYRNVLTSERYMSVPEGVIRRINVSGIFNVGYTSGNISETDLPESALELIEDGFYSKEEVLKMYTKRERVDEILFKKPMIKLIDGIPAIDKSDEEYTIEDLQIAMANSENTEEEVVIVSDNTQAVDSLLSELEGL